MKITSDYFTQIDDLPDESEKILDLNSFVIQQRDESIPYKTEKFEFSVLVSNLMKNSQKESYKFKNGIYKIIFNQLEDSYLFEIKFILSQKPGSWSNDLKISLYCKKESGIYEPVAKDCVMNTEYLSIDLCNFDITSIKLGPQSQNICNGENEDKIEGMYFLSLT